MHKLMDWLAVEALGVRKITGYIFLAALTWVALFYTVQAALVNWGFVEKSFDPDPENPFKYFNALIFLSLLVRAPLFEETIFRFVPLTITLFFTKRPSVVITVVVLFAALFGAIHPYDTIGQIQVAIGGLVNGIVFLKCGGLQNRVIKAWLCSVATHSTVNLFLLLYDYYDYLERVL